MQYKINAINSISIAQLEQEKLSANIKSFTQSSAVEFGEERKKYITDIPGQQMIYLRKEQEAKDWLVGTTEKTAENFPFIFNEIGLTADTPDQVAQVFFNNSYMWIQLALTMEKDRLTKLSQIKEAKTYEELRRIRGDYNEG